MKERGITLLGAHGLVGSRFMDLYKGKESISAPSHRGIDISNSEDLAEGIKRFNPSVIINFAGYTNVDEAETQRRQVDEGIAWKANVDGAENVAKLANSENIYLIHISSDYIFPGSEVNPGPYSEESSPAKSSEEVSWYGWTKLEAEKRLTQVGGKICVVRIAYPYRAHYENKGDFARNILMLFDKGELYPMFADQVLTPTYIDELCRVLAKLVEEQPTGIFHVASVNSTSPYEFADNLIHKARGKTGVVEKGSMKEFLAKPGKTPRPRLGGLSTKKIQDELGIELKSWQGSVDEMVSQLK